MIQTIKTAYFRCDASPATGSGHVMRCLTLATDLQDKGWECFFLSSPGTASTVSVLGESGFEIRPPGYIPDHADLLVVDHYSLDRTYESQCRLWAQHILVIDDLADRPHDCDVLLDQTYGRSPEDYQDLVPSACSIMTGPRYALLRHEFTRVRTRALARRTGKIERVLVSMGGTNIHNVTLKVIEGLALFTAKSLKIDVVLGAKAPHIESVAASIEQVRAKKLHDIGLTGDSRNMAALMAQADLAVGAGGTTSWERCCMGLPSIILEIADNQKFLARRLEDSGAIRNLGWHESVDARAVAASLESLVSNPQTVSEMSGRAAALCDGRGTDRVLPFLTGARFDKARRSVRLRLAEKTDAELTYAWQKIPETRRYFRNPQIPAWEEHVAWIHRITDDPSLYSYIIECAGKPSGFLRLNRRRKERIYEISILLDPAYKGWGVASCALRLARAMMPQAVFMAEILPENISSLALFQSAGYRDAGGGWHEQTA